MQRVSRAQVRVDGEVVGSVGAGLLVLLGVEVGDDEKDVAYMVDKLPNLRVFEDEAGKMNLSLMDIGGELLAVSQFTLHGDTRRGRRPSFSNAAQPEEAIRLYLQVVEDMKNKGIRVSEGVFRAHMEVELVNDGPVTLLLDSRKVF